MFRRDLSATEKDNSDNEDLPTEHKSPEEPPSQVPSTGTVVAGAAAEGAVDQSSHTTTTSMLLFCPRCGNRLVVEAGQPCHRFACKTCPYVHNITHKITSRMYPKLKEVDDMLRGAAAWENVDSTAERCPQCGHPRAYFMQLHTRSADKPATTFYKCCSPQCGHLWKD